MEEITAPPSLSELNDQLLPPVEPPPVPWWPATEAWAVLGGLLLLILLVLLARWLLRRRRSRFLRGLRARARSAAPAELPTLLRRAALDAEPRRNVAGLRGPAWVAHLAERAGRPAPPDAEGWLSTDSFAPDRRRAHTLDADAEAALRDFSDAYLAAAITARQRGAGAA
ncbi:DUF4381 family protein [Oceanomicrobium pacificus]|uniref:DUF4381 family protein n=1 Tax=Oceanomicrobium pacificus TaxID=2692916 RepID=A0A6B0TUJ6_9RHOB|nr:DUF4381 family protein [Oceanomicrobium pacificus]MXU65268.1 DUF4381 family protein [Oceanomicrobium pacificus]